MLQEIATVLAILVVTYIVLSYLMKPKGMPPGPVPLPIVGNLLTIIRSGSTTNNAPVLLTDLAKKHGNIYKLELPGQRVVVVNSIALAREALLIKKDDFAGRPRLFLMDFLTMGSKDIAIGDFSPTLVLQRKIVHSAIRMYQPFLEEKIIQEVNDLTKRLVPGKPTDPLNDIALATMNVIFAIAVGERYEHIDDEKFVEKVKLTKRLAAFTNPFNILNFLPFLIHLPIAQSTEIKQVCDEFHQYFIRKYHEHLESYQDGVVRDLTDGLIKARHEADQEDSKNCNLITDEHIVMTVFDVFIAGFETSSTALMWFMLFMVMHPEVQSKIHAELDEVLGPDTLPRWKDRTNLPYLVAAIDETLRKGSVAPLLLPHKATKDSTLAGYTIPNGTNLVFNTWAMHQDKQEWMDPDDFNTSRFINDDGKVSQVAGSKSFLPFGMGRRVCVGESLAKQELFLVASRLLHQFSLHKAWDSTPEITDDLSGAVHYPPPYEICFKQR